MMKRKNNILILVTLLCALLGTLFLKWSFEERIQPLEEKIEELEAKVKDPEEKAAEAYDLLLARFSPVQASAILSLIQLNSNFDPEAPDMYGGSGYGLMTWSFAREEYLKTFASQQGKDVSDFETQIQFIIEELNPKSRYYQLFSREGHQISDWENASTPKEAVEALCWMYERSAPSAMRLDLKIGCAEKYYTKFNK